MRKRTPTKRNRGINKDLVKAIIESFCCKKNTYKIKLLSYFLTKYCGFSLREIADELSISKTNVVYHIQSVSKFKKEDDAFLETYTLVEKMILKETEGIRKPMIYFKYNKPH